MTKRKNDENGFWEIKNNPISKVGIYEYSSEQIGAPVMGKVYRVYRPAAELEQQETINSFRLVPLIDDHEMLGDGFTPAEDKGVDGVIGEDVYFESPYLKANLKIFSQELKQKIESGKVELSCGYACEYDFTPGLWNGREYDAVQRRIRGNHIALVDEGRMGPDVKVLDHKRLTFDSMEVSLKKDAKMDKEKLLAALEAAITAVKEGNALSEDETTAIIDALGRQDDDDTPAADETEENIINGEDPTEDDEESLSETADDDDGDEEEEKKASGLDAKIRKAVDQALNRQAKKTRRAMDVRDVYADMAKREQLVRDLYPLVGNFDHTRMTTSAAARYGARKLGLDCARGQEISSVRAYLKAYQRVTSKQPPYGTVTDSRSAKSSIAAKFGDKK